MTPFSGTINHLRHNSGVRDRRDQLARADATIAFERILSRYPDIRLAVDPSRVVWQKRVGVRALSALPVMLK